MQQRRLCRCNKQLPRKVHLYVGNETFFFSFAIVKIIDMYLSAVVFFLLRYFGHFFKIDENSVIFSFQDILCVLYRRYDRIE